MKKLIAPLDFKFAELEENDLNLASELVNKYSLPIKDCAWLIRNFRDSIQDDLSESLFDEVEHGEIYKKYEQVLIGNIPLEITIKTDKGSLTISQTDPFYSYFYSSIQKIKRKIEKQTIFEKKRVNSVLVNSALLTVFCYLVDEAYLSLFQIYCIIGLFLVHFKLYKGKALLRREEFNKENSAAQDYEHYLYDIVKRRLANISNRFIVK